ncbi:MAG TPA: VCBS repeat-containing protein [Bacteroidales bacterium]|nr:VCBS repeat-containing protein [Bacteroidales bacterium]
MIITWDITYDDEMQGISNIRFTKRKYFTVFIFLLCSVITFSQPYVFKKYIIDKEIDGCSGLISEDIDGDGNIDIVGTSMNEGHVILWKNNGCGSINWEKIFIDTTFKAAMYPYTADIDNDGTTDVIAGSGAGIVAWWEKDASNHCSWTRHVIDSAYPGAHGIYACYMNNDSYVDIVASSADLNSIAWWENNGLSPVSWMKHSITHDFHTTQSCMAIDIDNDMDLDILGASSEDDEIAVWYNTDGSGNSWEKQLVSDSFDLAHWIYSCDLDNDGDQDILGAACISGEIAWWENDGNQPPGWKKHIIATEFACAVTVIAGDFDNDDDLDICGTSWYGDEIAIWENPGIPDSDWIKHSIETNFNGAWPIHANDLDNDGDIDLVAGGDVLNGNGENPPVSWWENQVIKSAK